MVFTPLNQLMFKLLLGGDSSEAEASVRDLELEEKKLSLMVDNRDQLQDHQKLKTTTIFRRLDEFILKPLLIRNYEERAGEIRKQKLEDRQEMIHNMV